MQLYAVNFIPLLGSLYMFGCFIHPSSGVQFLTVSTVTGTNHSIVSAAYYQRGLVLTGITVYNGTIFNCTYIP